MKELILHPHTSEALDQLLQRKPHAIMLVGNEGSGKRHIAVTLATELLGSPAQSHAYFLHLKPEGKSFTIEQIRDLQKHMKLKTTGDSDIRRVALLQDVHTLTIEAQNALLKILEEPPEDTVLILTAQSDQSLKPTVYSRVQKVQIKPITKQQLDGLSIARDGRDRMYELSGGDMGLLSALLQEDQDHELVVAISEAKKILTSTNFERLTRVDELGKDKEKLKTLLAATKRIAAAALKSSVAKNDTKNTKRWAAVLENTHNCEGMLGTNMNTKLVLTELFLSI